jgi:hypothetical protein
MKKHLAFAVAALFAASAFAQTEPFGTFTKPFAVDSPWNIRPIGPVFGAYPPPKGAYFGAVSAGAYSTAAFLAKESDLPMVVYPPLNTTGISDPDAGTSVPTVTIAHWPASTLPATGSDGHAEIVDPISGKVHSFWQLKLVDGKWRAALHAWSALAGRGWGDPAHFYQGARAAGVSTLGGLIRIHEVTDGKAVYEHALAMSMAKEGLSANPAFIYPATAADNNAASTNSGEIPEGTLMMLPPDYKISYNSPLLQKVIETLKVYGARVVDRNTDTPFAIYVENGAPFKLWTGTSADNAMYNEMERMRAAMRQVISANSYVDGNGQPTTTDKPGNFNILSMRGAWGVTGTAGGTPAPYNSLTQSVEFASRPAAQEQANGNGTGIARGVTWARPLPNDKFLLTGIGTGGAQVKLTLYGNDAAGKAYSYQSPYLSNGQSTVVTWPASGGWAVVAVRIGANQAGSIRATMVKQ